MIKNIVIHLENLRPIPGEIIYKPPSEKDKEIAVPGCILYKKNKRLYYLQTDQVEGPNPIDNVCSKIQMTFSAKAEDIINIILKITKDYTFEVNISEIEDSLVNNENDIIKINTCVEKLYEKLFYTNLSKDYKNKLKDKKIQIKQVKTYLFLILFKLYRFYIFSFYNDLEISENKQQYNYLKDVLFFNSRHTNYVLYSTLKTKIKEIFDLTEDSQAIEIIKNMILQPEILSEYLIDDFFKTEEYNELIDANTIFSKDTIINKDNDDYGNPTYSLNSYFDFFEDPINNEKNKKLDGVTIKYHDWLEYDEHDIFSAHMDINNDIVLLECRFFQDLLTAYFYNNGDASLKEQMTNGACNKLTGKEGNPNTTALSIANFKKILELKQKGGFKRNKTRKHKKILNKKIKKTKNHKIKKSKKEKTRKRKN
jgi:hypothetical protein